MHVVIPVHINMRGIIILYLLGLTAGLQVPHSEATQLLRSKRGLYAATSSAANLELVTELKLTNFERWELYHEQIEKMQTEDNGPKEVKMEAFEACVNACKKENRKKMYLTRDETSFEEAMEKFESNPVKFKKPVAPCDQCATKITHIIMMKL